MGLKSFLYVEAFLGKKLQSFSTGTDHALQLYEGHGPKYLAPEI